MKCNYIHKRLVGKYENFQALSSPKYYFYAMLTSHSNITATLPSGKDGSKTKCISIFSYMEKIKMYTGNCYI